MSVSIKKLQELISIQHFLIAILSSKPNTIYYSLSELEMLIAVELRSLTWWSSISNMLMGFFMCFSVKNQTKGHFF